MWLKTKVFFSKTEHTWKQTTSIRGNFFTTLSSFPMEGLKLERRFTSCSHVFKQFHLSIVKGTLRRDKNFLWSPKNLVNSFSCALVVFKVFDSIVEHKFVQRILSYLINLSYIFFLSILYYWPIFFSAQLSKGCKIK